MRPGAMFSRREWLSLVGLAAASALAAEKPAARTFKIIGFVKPFQRLPFDQMADTAREVGWSGIECPVRKDGAIEPERAEDELPKLVEALRQRDLELSVISTDVEDASEALTQRVLKTASKLRIPRYRLKHYYYDLNKPIPPQLENFKAKLRDLAQLNRELNVQGAMQNHSGRNYVGAAGWDLWEMMRELDPKSMGVFFDIGHAALEGGYSWPSQAKLLEPYFSTISVKDFFWRDGGKGGRSEWCPLGQGVVRREFFDFLKKSNFNGPITQQFEFPLGAGQEMIAAMRKDLTTLKGWLGL
jgi:sugar phosphate isomerase/epimerase